MKPASLAMTFRLITTALFLATTTCLPHVNAQFSINSTATLTYTGGNPDVNNLDGKEINMEIIWPAATTWVTVSNLMQAVSQSTTITIDGQAVDFPATGELPVILNIVNNVDDRQAYADTNENVIINFTAFGQVSSTRSLIHPDAPPIEVANGDPLQRCHLETGYNLLGQDGFFRELFVGGAQYSYSNIGESITGGTRLKGDVNQDCVVNLLDVDPFIDRLSTATYQYEADTNDDGVMNLLDVDFFIELLDNQP